VTTAPWSSPHNTFAAAIGRHLQTGSTGELVLVIIDELNHLLCGRPGWAAKKADAAFTIAFAR